MCTHKNYNGVKKRVEKDSASKQQKKEFLSTHTHTNILFFSSRLCNFFVGGVWREIFMFSDGEAILFSTNFACVLFFRRG